MPIEEKRFAPKKQKERAPASVLAISVVLGGITMAITSILPGGLRGASGFLVGVVVSFLIIAALVALFGQRSRSLVSRYEAKKPEAGEESKPVESITVTCPSCGEQIEVVIRHHEPAASRQKSRL